MVGTFSFSWWGEKRAVRDREEKLETGINPEWNLPGRPSLSSKRERGEEDGLFPLHSKKSDI